MTKTYRFRVVLDVEEDVLCDLDIPAENTLYELHLAILKAFELDEGEMASFYRSNENWDQGEEISLIEMGLPGGVAMSKIGLKEAFPKQDTKMIYVYDLIALWTFYVELIETGQKGIEKPFIARQVGKRPDKAPVKKMEADPDIDMSDWDVLLNNENEESDED